MAYSEILEWQIASIFIIFAASLASYLLTLRVVEKSLADDSNENSTVVQKSDDSNENSAVAVPRQDVSSSIVIFESFKSSDVLNLIKCFSAGIIFGVATMHLLADGQESLAEYYPAYPLGLALFSVGILITMMFDHVAFFFLEKFIKVTVHQSFDGEANENPNDSNDLERKKHLDKKKDLLNACVLEAGIAVHSIIFGFAMGAIDNSKDQEGYTKSLHEVKILFAIYVIHQV